VNRKIVYMMESIQKYREFNMVHGCLQSTTTTSRLQLAYTTGTILRVYYYCILSLTWFTVVCWRAKMYWDDEWVSEVFNAVGLYCIYLEV